MIPLKYVSILAVFYILVFFVMGLKPLERFRRLSRDIQIFIYELIFLWFFLFYVIILKYALKLDINIFFFWTRKYWEMWPLLLLLILFGIMIPVGYTLRNEEGYKFQPIDISYFGTISATMISLLTIFTYDPPGFIRYLTF